MPVTPLQITAFDLATRFVGTKEAPGSSANPLILAMLDLDTTWPTDDDVPWCSAFANFVAWLLRLPRSKALNARSWLLVGRPVDLRDAIPGFDVVIFNRGGSPDPSVVASKGHVGFFAGIEGPHILVLGGNQGDSVSIARLPQADLLGIRRLVP